MNSRQTLFLVVGLIAMAGCKAEPPDNSGPAGPVPDGGGADYADLVVSFTEADNSTRTCTEAGTAVCEQQTGSCQDHPALGAPDDIRYSLAPAGALEIAFICRPILDRVQGESPASDFRVWATGASASNPGVVSVSRDGGAYQTLGTLNSDNQDFYITDEGFDYVRFIRISGGSAQTIQIDAIEALR